MEVLEEEYKTQQNMLINYTSKYETLNHLLSQIVIREEGRNIYNNNNNNNIKSSYNDNESNKLYDENINDDVLEASNYLKSEELLLNKFHKETSNQAENYNSISSKNVNNNDSIDSSNSNKRKKKFIYTKIPSLGNLKKEINLQDNKTSIQNNENHLQKNCDTLDNKNNTNSETNSEVYEKNKINNNNLSNEDREENQIFVYEKVDTYDKIELEEIKSFEFILLDLIKFPQLLLDKLTNGKADLYKKLTQDYLRDKFSKIVELVKFSRNSYHNTQISSSSSKNNSCCNDSNNSIYINNEGEVKKNFNNFKNDNFKKIKFSNKILNVYSRKVNNEENNLNEQNSNFNNNLNSIGFDENFLLDLIIKDLVLITNIKYEKIERVVNLLIKINYVNKNLRLREDFLFKEYPQSKKFLMDKILYIEKRIEAKYEKIKTINFYIKKTESKLNEINKNLNMKKNELGENKNYLSDFEAEIKAMRENEENLQLQINDLNKEKQNIENEFNQKVTEIVKDNKKLEDKLSKKNQKLRELNELKLKHQVNSIDSNANTNRTNDRNINNSLINDHDNYNNNNKSIIDQYNIPNEINNKIQHDDIIQSKSSKNYNFNGKTSPSTVNKYKRNRTKNISNGINCPISISYRQYEYPENIENLNNVNNQIRNNDNNNNNTSKDQERYLNEYPNDKERKFSNDERSSRSRSTKNKIEKNYNQFKVNNNIYTKYHYPNDNKTNKKREVSFDSNSFKHKTYKNHYMFEEKLNSRKSINSNSKNNNTSISSKKSFTNYIANYGCSPNNTVRKSIDSIRNLSKNRNTKCKKNNENRQLRDKNEAYSRTKFPKRESEFSSKYIDPELLKNLNDAKYSNKHKKRTFSKNSNSSNNDISSRSRGNSLRVNQASSNKEKKGLNNFNTLKTNRNSKSDYLHKIEHNDKINKNQVNNLLEESGGNIINSNNNNNVEIDNYSHTSIRRFRNPSYAKLLNENYGNEKLEKDKMRFTINKTNQEELNETWNDKNNYYKQNPKDNQDTFHNNDYSIRNNNNIINSEINCEYKNKNNLNKRFNYESEKRTEKSDDCSRSEASPGAAYLRKNQANKHFNDKENLYYETNPVKEHQTENDNKSINTNNSARNFILLNNNNRTKRNSYDLEIESKEIKNYKKPPIKNYYKDKNLVEETKNLIYGSSDSKPIKDNYNYNTINNALLLKNSIPNYNSNDNSNNSFRNNSKNKNINFSDFNTTGNSNRYHFDNFSSEKNYKGNIKDNYKESNNLRSNKINDKNYDYSALKERKPAEKEKIDLLNLNYHYELTQKTRQNTDHSIADSVKKSKINHVENTIKTYKNKITNSNYTRNHQNQTLTSRFEIPSNSNENFVSDADINEIKSFKSDTFYNSNINKTIKLSDEENDFSANNYFAENEKITNKDSSYYNKPYNKSDYNNSNEIIQGKFLSKRKDENNDLNCFAFNEKLFHLEQGCIIYKRNNYYGAKNFSKISSNIFYSSDFNPLDYGFKKHFCAFDPKANKINFTKDDNFSEKKLSNIYIASITSFKIPNYTKNLVFIKQVYKKYLKSFNSIEHMDDFITNNTHFLVNLYYDNCKDKDIKFDNRLYSKEFRRELLNNNNFIVYLNLLSDNTRIEIMFLEYEDYKYWINGLQELVSLKNC